MTKPLLALFILIVIDLSTCSQYAYDQHQSSSSTTPFSEKKDENNFPINAGEKYLILNKTPRIGKFRHYRFLIGQQVNFKVENDKKRFKATILGISDSSITISSKMDGSTEHREIQLNDIRIFKVSRRIPFVSEAAYYFPIGGLLYIGADFVNKGIDDKRFTTDASAFIVGGALIAAGFFCHKLSSRTIKINNRNRLRVLTAY
jgi:hypothetical protein